MHPRGRGHCGRGGAGSRPKPDTAIYASGWSLAQVAITLAVIGAVIGEFVGSEDGLRYFILASTSQSRTPAAFAALVLLTIISIVFYYSIAFIERIIVP